MRGKKDKNVVFGYIDSMGVYGRGRVADITTLV